MHRISRNNRVNKKKLNRQNKISSYNSSLLKKSLLLYLMNKNRKLHKRIHNHKNESLTRKRRKRRIIKNLKMQITKSQKKIPKRRILDHRKITKKLEKKKRKKIKIARRKKRIRLMIQKIQTVMKVMLTKKKKRLN